MSLDATRWVWGLKIPTGPKFVLLYIADRADASRRAWPSVARIATDTSITERTVYRHIIELTSMGLLSVESSPGKSSVYRIVMNKPRMDRGPLTSCHCNACDLNMNRS